MTLLLETRDLTKTFGRARKAQIAVDRVTIHVEEGEVYGLLGPNGAGKSTLLKMIAGMLTPTSGTLLFDERPWTRDDLYAIGSLIENPPLYANLTARENMQVRALALGLDKPDALIEETLAAVGLPDTGNKRAGRFSLGMKQRLGIAMALLGHPRLLILDEPTNGLDPIGIEDMRALIRSFANQGITVIVSSHILAEVAHVADTVGIITAGALAYEGPFENADHLTRLFMETCRTVADERASIRRR